LAPEVIVSLERYYTLVMAWTGTLHLVAPCSPQEFATRHVLESLLLLKHLPSRAMVVDLGSGAGLPIVPCLLVRADLRSILIESSQKKAVFLKQAVRLIPNPGRAQIELGRFEQMPAPATDFVTCRALDRFGDQLPKILEWPPSGTTFLLYVGAELRKKLESRLTGVSTELIPMSDRRFLLQGRRPPLSDLSGKE
jgi:16S rRNA (guanine527-N7)-methyltransferase